MNIFSCRVMMREKWSCGICELLNASSRPRGKATPSQAWGSIPTIPTSFPAVRMAPSRSMMSRKAPIHKINCMQFQTVSMKSSMGSKWWKTASTWSVPQAKAVSLSTRGTTFRLIATGSKVFRVLLTVCSKLTKARFWQAQKMVLCVV